MLREVVLDTETTGLDPLGGDRLVEIGCIELVNRIPTGREFHRYVNPERSVPQQAFAVHGLSTEFLQDKPHFAAIADELLEFIGEDLLVIHNAGFDIAFLNAELSRAGRKEIAMERVFDTLALARRRHPAGPNSLDALCKRYGIDSSSRVKHGALLDSLLLASVYVELLGERQASLGLVAAADTPMSLRGLAAVPALARPRPLPPRLSPEAEAAHRAYVATLGPKPLWLRLLAFESRESSVADEPCATQPLLPETR